MTRTMNMTMNTLKESKMSMLFSMDDKQEKITKSGSEMAAGQSNKLYSAWLLVLILVFAANHIEYHFRMRSISEKSKKMCLCQQYGTGNEKNDSNLKGAQRCRGAQAQRCKGTEMQRHRGKEIASLRSQ